MGKKNKYKNELIFVNIKIHFHYYKKTKNLFKEQYQ